MRWYADRPSLRLVLAGYLPWLALLSLGWEAAHLPLYTLWHTAAPGFIAFAVLHCTAGDVLIGLAALAGALVMTRSADCGRWNGLALGAAAAALAIGYTAFSEWMNTSLLESWAYGEAMPVLHLARIELGVTPLLQWAVIPPAALWLARRGRTRHAAAAGAAGGGA